MAAHIPLKSTAPTSKFSEKAPETNQSSQSSHQLEFTCLVCLGAWEAWVIIATRLFLY